LASEDLATALSQALTHIIDHEPNLIRILRDEVVPTVHRQPIGPLLASLAP